MFGICPCLAAFILVQGLCDASRLVLVSVCWESVTSPSLVCFWLGLSQHLVGTGGGSFAFPCLKLFFLEALAKELHGVD